MTTTLDLPEDLIEDVQLRAAQEGRGLDETVTELIRAGLAASPVRTATVIRADAAMLEARIRAFEGFLTGELGFDLSGFEEGRAGSAPRRASKVTRSVKRLQRPT
jgi:plasmid stability protein